MSTTSPLNLVVAAILPPPERAFLAIPFPFSAKSSPRLKNRSTHRIDVYELCKWIEAGSRRREEADSSPRSYASPPSHFGGYHFCGAAAFSSAGKRKQDPASQRSNQFL